MFLDDSIKKRMVRVGDDMCLDINQLEYLLELIKLYQREGTNKKTNESFGRIE